MQLPQYLNCLDLGIVPSLTTRRWKEQFGRVLVEFMSCEVPVIGSNSGAIPEVLGDAGWIFPENDLQELLRMVKNPYETGRTTKKIRHAWARKSHDFYSVEIMSKRFLSMYQGLME